MIFIKTHNQNLSLALALWIQCCPIY